VNRLVTMDNAVRWMTRLRGVLLPAAAAGGVLVIFVPLPAALMDVLLVATVALSAIILLTTLYVASPLEFNLFPSVLLGATLLRLVLNVGLTRLILTAGADDSGEPHLAAGRVVWAFSDLIGPGTLSVGLILLVLIAIIQFVVVTRGAGRISEVTARFVLDAMPGKQMGIDADLAAGLIDDDQARRRRAGIAAEADFYGAMDGASKFLRGEVVASVLIVLVNVLGGLYVGTMQYGWTWGRTLDLFARLAVGAGLVMQVSGLIVSMSAALLVTRSTARTNFPDEVVRQLTHRPVVLGITAGLLAALCLTQLPKLPLLILGAACAGLAWVLAHRPVPEQTEPEAPPPPPVAKPGQDVEGLLSVDPLRIDLGYTLIRLAEPSMGGDLTDRIGGLRRRIALELGLLLPPVRIRDDMNLEAHAYAVKIRGAKVAGGRLYPGQLLAVGGEDAAGKLLGRQDVEPAFQTPAVWINREQRGRAETMGYTVVEPPDVLMTHMTEIVRRHAADLLSREQVARLLENLKPVAGALVQDVTRKLRPRQIQRVLQDLLREQVSIRDLETILEAAGEAAERTDDVRVITEQVRAALARQLAQQYAGQDGKLCCVSLDPGLEEALGSYVRHGEADFVGTVPPDLGRKVARGLTDALTGLQRSGRKPVVLCAPRIRPMMRRLIAPVMPDAAVLGYNEIESVEVETTANVGMDL